MSKRVLLWVMTIALLSGAAMPGWAKAAPTPAPNVPAKAGNITALLPVAHLVRGAGKTAVITDAKKGDELVWNDLVKTEKGGRARITLSDQSILSLGSQAELRIVKHDARTQQTSLQMAYGRVRAQVASITRDGGSFELRTPTAVAGVIGTDFGVDSSVSGGDTFVCIAGATQISNSDPNVPGAVQCSAGQTTTVAPGKSPTAPTPASLQQLQQLIEDTEPAIISSISPAAALPGTNFDSNIAGSKMGKVTSVNVAGGSGVSVSIKGASETSVQIHVVVDATASAGPRTITLVKEAGASSATVFTVLGTPIGDPKKAYLETLEQLKSTGVGGLGAFLTGAQQAADQVAQQITQANQNLPKPLDLSPFADSLNQQYGVLSNDLKGGTGSIDKAAQDAATTFAGLYDTAYQALLQRDPTGTPDTTFTNALTAAFTQANSILQAALQNTQTGLSGAVQTYGNQLNTIQQTWSQNINTAFIDQQAGPLPKINALERIVELGSSATFDAGSSSASNAGASITSYQWTLCSQNYQPTGFGQLLPEGQAACNGIQGFVSNSPEFQIATCTLAPGSYFARLAVTDSNNKISQMDVKLTVLSPNYPTPGGTVRSLADAYTSLQLSQFLRLFDAAQFNGYTPLSENVRQTMQSLASMAINLRLSQENVTCNDATVRADWQQNYTFIGDAATVYNQTEQLSVRLQRVPGNGWYITDFQGDNGKVQGVVPGPQTADTASPDLAVAGTTIDGRPVSSGTPIQVGAGPRTVVVDITNNGTATFANGAVLPVTITLQDTNGTNVTTIDTFNGSVPNPINVGSTMPVQATLNFPTSATNLTMLVQVNPSCNPPEKTCGAPNNVSYPLLLGLPDFTATFVPTATVNGIVGRSFNLQAVNVTPSPYPVALNVAYTGLPAGLAAASPANNTTNINGALVAGAPSATGSSTLAATATSAGVTKNVTGSATIVVGNEITVTPTSAPSFIAGGVAQNLTFNVAGGVYPVTVALALPTGFTTTSGTITAGVSRQVLNAPGAVTFALTAGVSSGLGNQSFSVVATDPGIPASNTPAGNKTFVAGYTVTGLADLQVGAVQIPPAIQMGAVVSADIPVFNSGPVAAAAGWSLVVNINGNQAGTITGPAIPAGQTVTVTLNLTIPQIGAPPVSTSVPAVITLNGNNAIQETNTGNNTFSANLTLVDFVLSTIPTIAQGVVGRSINFPAVNVLPTPFAIPIQVSYTGVPAGVGPSVVANPNGLTGDRVLGIPTSSGASTITASGNTGTVTHAATGSIALSIANEITVSQVAPITLATGGVSQNLVLNIAGGIYPVTVAVTLPNGITTTSGTINGNIATQTISGPGPLTFAMSATATATVGAQNFLVAVTDPGVPATSTPAGSVTSSLPFTVTGLADLQPGLLNATAGQQGATYTEQLTVSNIGNAAAAAGWDVKIILNGQTVGTGTGPAIPAGQQVIVPVTVNIPVFQAPPLDQIFNGTSQVNTNLAIPEISTGNNSSNYSQRVVDFVLSSTPQVSMTGVVGRSYAANQVVSLNPTPYPTNVTVSFPGAPAGLAGNGVGGGLLLPNLVGIPTTAGTANIAPSAIADGVTHSSAVPISLTIVPEIVLTQQASPTLTSGGGPGNLVVGVTGGIYPVTVALTLPTGITTTNGTIVGNVSSQTITGPGNVTWAVSADFTAAAGTGLLANIVAADAGNPLTTTPGGNVPFQANYTVNGNANFSITGVTVTGHTAPYTLTNAFQVDEATQFQVTVKNTGNTSPTGNVTVVLDCGNASICDTPLTITAPAPAAGASAVVPVDVQFQGFVVASYAGSVSLTTDVSGAGVGAPVSIPFDIVDFTIANASIGPFQNLPIGGIATLDVSVNVQRPSGSAFGISITAAPTDPALVFVQPNQITSGASIAFPLTVGASAISGQGAVRFNATNHGVIKFVDVPYVAFTANLSSTTLFVNDSANPLTVPVAVGAQAPTNYPTVGLKLISNFDHANGSANLTVQQPGCGSFSATLFPPTAIPNDVVDLPIFAAAGNTCPAGTQVVIIADIPQTFPQVTIPVYALFVAPSGLPQLSVVSATPARDISTQPWLSGEPLDWTVVVQNTGSAASTGNEKVTMSVGAGEIGVGTVAGPIPAGQSTSVNVHTVAPDYPQSQNVGTTLNVSVKVQSDSRGDLSPGTGGTNIIANFSNWGIGIISGNGVSDGTPLDLSPTASSNSADIAISNQAAFNPNVSLSLVPGSYSLNKLNAPSFSPNSLTSESSSTVTVSYPSASALTNGLYFVQVIAQMKDGATVTAQRQTTIHVRLTNQANSSPAGITLASDRTNIGPAGQCSAPGCQTIQINGPLPEAFTLTASVSSCSAGNGCPGTADISFSDSFMTVTTPPVSTVQVTSPGNTLPVRVKAADNPDGTINVGNARVDVSVNAVTASFFGGARTPTPDPVGTKFEMNFNIGDLNITAPICVGVPPQDTAAVQPGTPIAWVVSNGFNVASVQWEWQDPNHVPAGASPLGFSPASGSSTFTGNGYTALPTFNLTNPTTGVDGLQTYYFAFTVSNGVATATKYFPIDVDLSRSQTFCPIVGANRGAANVRLIRGSWGKAGLNAANVGALRSARAAALSTKLPDLRISASDISFTPSIPKPGDTVAVRFRISNVGDGDAAGVPVALQVHGKTVVSDTFDIPAGKTVLGGLEWANARPAAGTVDSATARADAVAARRLVRTARLGVDQATTDPTTRGGGNADMRAQIVIDPLKTITQKTTLAKSAALTHFGMRNSAADAATLAAINEQRVLLELPEGGCGGLKFVAGAGSCTSADITFTVEDLAKATYKLESLNGISDLGAGATSYANASFGSQALGQNGHTYAVQLNGGKVGLVTVTAVRNPEQLSEAAKRLFRQRHPVSVVKSLGGNTDAPDTGDTAGTGSQPMVYFDIVYQGQ